MTRSLISRTALALAAAMGLALTARGALAAGEDGMKVIGHIPGPDGGWDYASYDPVHRRIYVTHGTVVLALDLASGKLNANFAPGNRLHEVVVVPGHDLLVTTNSGDSTVRILKASDGSLIKSLSVAADADGAAYDPATKLVVVINGDAGVLTLIDPVKQEVVGKIDVGDHLEFGQPDGKGRFYVNVESTGQVAVVDLVGRKVVGRYDMAGCQRPTGLAYVEGDRVISSCGGLAKILDAASGKEIASLKIGGFPDAVIYDPVRHVAYVPTALDGHLWAIALAGPNNNTIVASIPTQVGARTGAVDTKTGRVYLPTAEYLPMTPGQGFKTKPGTFQILVVGRE
jgi:DNA-binding beta-propeller fold protein YncE